MAAPFSATASENGTKSTTNTPKTKFSTRQRNGTARLESFSK